RWSGMADQSLELEHAPPVSHGPPHRAGKLLDGGVANGGRGTRIESLDRNRPARRLPPLRARRAVEQDEMHVPLLGVHPLRGLVGHWPTAREREDQAGVVRPEPSLDLFEHVGCEAVERAIRRTRAVHAARLDDRNRLVATQRVGEEAVLEGVPTATGQREQTRPPAALV